MAPASEPIHAASSHEWAPNIKQPTTTHLSATPKLFFTLLLSKIACQAPKPTPSKQDKTFAKVVFSYGQSDIIELEIKKAPATVGAFSVSNTSTASKSFTGTNLAASPMVANI
jgi:hypothetical protein